MPAEATSSMGRYGPGDLGARSGCPLGYAPGARDGAAERGMDPAEREYWCALSEVISAWTHGVRGCSGFRLGGLSFASIFWQRFK